MNKKNQWIELARKISKQKKDFVLISKINHNNKIEYTLIWHGQTLHGQEDLSQEITNCANNLLETKNVFNLEKKFGKNEIFIFEKISSLNINTINFIKDFYYFHKQHHSFDCARNKSFEYIFCSKYETISTFKDKLLEKEILKNFNNTFKDIITKHYKYKNLEDITIFGAGNVGKEIVNILAKLPLNAHIIDENKSKLDKIASADNISKIQSNFSTYAKNITLNHYVLIMTSNYETDLSVCSAVLESSHELKYLGVIGSKQKKERLTKDLKNQNIDDGLISKLICPIGENFTIIKSPLSIAVSICFEIINLIDKAR